MHDYAEVVRMSVYDKASSGDLRATLEAMRDDLAAAMDVADPAVKAQLNGQLLKVVQTLAGLPDETVNRTDELAKRRADRVSKARASAPANKQVQRRSGR